jgi:1-acyl-sn-glycerol-3-phosphate acyltransferase
MLMYPEGGRSRTGGIAEPRPGVGRIALQSGVPVIPVAIHGSAGVRGWRKLRFPKVTVQYGEPLTFDVVSEPTRDQQIGVATEIFKHVREMYDNLDAKGRRGVIKALREGIASPAEQKVPAEQSR